MAIFKTRELLDSMTSSDRKSFISYLDSPYFNCSIQVKELYRLFENGNESEEDREKVYSGLFPGKTYDDKQLRYIISDLNQHLVRFFMLKQLEKKPLLEQSVASEALAVRSCDKAYSLVHHELTTGNGYRDATWHFLQFEHAEKHLVFSAPRLNRKATPDYTDTLDNLDTFYLAKKLQLSCEVANLSNVLKKEYKIALLDSVKQLASTQPFAGIPAVKIYYNILEMLTGTSPDQHFSHVEALLKSHPDNFHPRELGEMYQYLKNYCVRKINQGETVFLRTLFNLYGDMLSNKSLMNYDYLSQWEFKNIVSISLRLEEKTWCDQFIHKYINHLKPAERNNAMAYNLAYSWFMNGDFRKAIRKLQEVELNDVFYQLDARVIILKSYFELDDYDSFFYQVSSFRLFLLRNRFVSDFQKNIYRNLIRFLAAIMRAGTSRKKLLQIKAEVEKEKNVADLNWLMKKLDEAIGLIGSNRLA